MKSAPASHCLAHLQEQSRRLADEDRLRAFQHAIRETVRPGDQVVELGASGLLSLWAAQCGAQVTCIDPHGDALSLARALIQSSPAQANIRWVQADYRDDVVQEAVDIVLCDHLHPALIEAPQIALADDFRQRHAQRFGRTPRFLPDTSLLAVQPVEQDYDFYGCTIPQALYQETEIQQTRTTGLGDPAIYHIVEYHLPASRLMRADFVFAAQADGRLNALRFISKHLLAIQAAEQRSIDWLSPYLVLPLPEPIFLQAGDRLRLRFAYLAGTSLPFLTESLWIEKLPQADLQALLGGVPLAASQTRAQA